MSITMFRELYTGKGSSFVSKLFDQLQCCVSTTSSSSHQEAYIVLFFIPSPLSSTLLSPFLPLFSLHFYLLSSSLSLRFYLLFLLSFLSFLLIQKCSLPFSLLIHFSRRERERENSLRVCVRSTLLSSDISSLVINLIITISSCFLVVINCKSNQYPGIDQITQV